MIAVTIIVGWLLQRSRVIPPQSANVLSALAYWACTPALLFAVIASHDIISVMGKPFIAAAASGVGSALAFFVVGVGALRLRGGDLVLGSMSASVNNIAYMGIPIAVYVLGSAHHVVPVLAFQMVILTPVFFVLAELAGKQPSAGTNTVWRIVKTTVTNPMVIGAVGGAIVSALQIQLPEFITETADFLGQAAPPIVLIAFGASLVGQSIHMPRKTWIVVSLASASKLLIQPLIAGLVGWLLGVTGITLAGVIIMAALPTAQNAFIASMRANAGKKIAQGTVLLTTIVSLPLTVLLVGLLGAVGIYTAV